MVGAARLLIVIALWAAAGAALARPPVVVELFTAQGCASCGAADALVAKLADRPDVVALTFSVDYWDYLGWKDTFAQAEFADRQRAYEHRLGLRDVFTPQVIIGGAAQTSGDRPATVEALIADVRHHAARAPEIRILTGGRIGVGFGARPVGGAEVWLIRFDPHEQTVEIKDGDNRGTRVSEHNVVRQLVRLGAWSGTPVVLKTPPPTDDGLATAIVVQGEHGGRIVGALVAPAAGAGQAPS
jgi:hypothetical protein